MSRPPSSSTCTFHDLQHRLGSGHTRTRTLLFRVDAAMAELGRVDVLINNAGLGTAVPATRATPAQFRSVIDVNLNGSYWGAQAAARVMTPGSSIINISSVLGLTTAGLPQVAYAASKAGVIGLTCDLAQQWGAERASASTR